MIKPKQPTKEQQPTDEPEVPINGKIKVNGMWSLAVWLLSPFHKSGPALILAIAVLGFIAYEADKIGGPLIAKYGEYVDGQTSFTKTVEKGMQSQTKATEDVRVLAVALQDLTAQNAVMIEANSKALRVLAAEGTEPAKHIQQLMTEAAELMKPVPTLREENNRMLQELIDTQKEVLATLKLRPNP